MIEGMLLGYAGITLPFVAYAAYVMWKKGLARTAASKEEARPNYGQMILEDMQMLREKVNNVSLAQEESRKDHHAMLHSMQAVARSVLDIKPAPIELPKRVEKREMNMQNFVYSLEYVRDNFAKTDTQRKAVESIISTIKTSHGSAK